MRAPTKVIGRLRNRPTTAAAKPLRASSVSWVDVNPVCPTSGAMRTPARAASMKPNTQPICDIRYGLAPASATRSGSSTTARMATPSRARRRKMPSATPTTAVTTTIMICWYCSVTPLVPKRWTDSTVPFDCVKYGVTERITSGLLQKMVATPSKMTRSPSDTMSDRSTVAPWMRRKSTYSTTRARRGASTNTMNTMASRNGQWSFCHNSQYENAATMPTAPWAKLKTPVVL